MVSRLAPVLLAVGILLIPARVFGQDDSSFTAYVRELADQGDAAAQSDLGFMYANGSGVTEDAEEAVRWFRLAADQGGAAAQNNLGLMYETGAGVLQDYVEAVRWYRLAADQGGAEAQYNLGVMYAKGEGVLQDDVRAHMWVNLSAAQGIETARELREAAASEMTPEQITQAQAMARQCLESNYSDCD